MLKKMVPTAVVMVGFLLVGVSLAPIALSMGKMMAEAVSELRVAPPSVAEAMAMLASVQEMAETCSGDAEAIQVAIERAYTEVDRVWAAMDVTDAQRSQLAVAQLRASFWAERALTRCPV